MEKERVKVILKVLEESDREQFILDNQEAFKYGALEEFGLRDDHIDDDGEIISRKTIEESIDAPNSEALRIIAEGRCVGGAVVSIDHITNHNHLDLLFISPKAHSRGIGFAAWCEIEKRYPETSVWETITPYFEKRNIHFYINKCGFHAVEFFCEHHYSPYYNNDDIPRKDSDEGPDEMLRFEKVMKNT